MEGGQGGGRGPSMWETGPGVRIPSMEETAGQVYSGPAMEDKGRGFRDPSQKGQDRGARGPSMEEAWLRALGTLHGRSKAGVLWDPPWSGRVGAGSLPWRNWGLGGRGPSMEGTGHEWYGSSKEGAVQMV